MSTLEKLFFYKEHGVSISYIAEQAELVPATVTKWMRGEKGITSKNEKRIEHALQQLAKELWNSIGDNNDRNLSD